MDLRMWLRAAVPVRFKILKIGLAEHLTKGNDSLNRNDLKNALDVFLRFGNFYFCICGACGVNGVNNLYENEV